MLYCLFYPKIEYRSIESLNLSNLQKMYKKQPSTPRSQNPIIFQDKLDSKETFKYSRVPHSYFEKKIWRRCHSYITLPQPMAPPQYIYIYTPPLPWKAMPNIWLKRRFYLKAVFFLSLIPEYVMDIRKLINH